MLFGSSLTHLPVCSGCTPYSTAEITFPATGSSMSSPLDPGWVGAPYWVQGIELLPLTSGCSFAGIPLTLSPCYQLTIGNM